MIWCWRCGEESELPASCLFLVLAFPLTSSVSRGRQSAPGFCMHIYNCSTDLRNFSHKNNIPLHSRYLQLKDLISEIHSKQHKSCEAMEIVKE